ncbi:hypothetical protein NDU88_004937 [Pleurodeles waltl]|uniref:Uncharacterized protein n=1 Tax=Pleurodeles waltl TaxID=8319 RepID=A0AAV7VLS5_PLEWA|nr:hypothetical protein NDU88_004937 [Pleurodeles waltl]
MTDTLQVSLSANTEVPPVEQRAVPTLELGDLAILTDIRQTLSTLTVPPAMAVVHTAAPVQAATPIVSSPALQGLASSTTRVPTQDETMQALLAVAQLLSIINASSTTASPITPWATNDRLKNSVAELKLQVEAIAAGRSATAAPCGAAGPSVIPSPGVQSLASNSIDKGKITESSNYTSGGGTAAVVAGQDMLLSCPALVQRCPGKATYNEVFESSGAMEKTQLGKNMDGTGGEERKNFERETALKWSWLIKEHNGKDELVSGERHLENVLLDTSLQRCGHN